MERRIGWGSMEPSAPLVEALGWLGFVGAEVLFYSPAVTTFRRILSDKSVAGFDHLPYVVSVVNCVFWVAYASLAGGRFQPLLTNAVGGVAEVAYVIIFLTYAKTWHCARDSMLAILFGAAVIAYAFLMPFPRVNGEASSASCLGMAAAAVNIAMYAAPLKIVRQVIATRSTRFMPLSLTVGGLSCSIAWTIYAVLVGDVSIFVPNFAGDVLGVAQLLVYVAYHRSSPPDKIRVSSADDADEVKADDGALKSLDEEGGSTAMVTSSSANDLARPLVS